MGLQTILCIAEYQQCQNLLQYCSSMDVIPNSLLEPLQRTLEAAKAFVRENTKVACINEAKLHFLIRGLHPRYKHYTLDCISFKLSMRSICGFHLSDFIVLLAHLEPHLRSVFPNCEMISHERSQCCEIRFKLFLTLLHMKMGVSYATMSQIFGWSKSSIAEWCQLIRKVISKVG